MASTGYGDWGGGEPNGDTSENCVLSWKHWALNDLSCEAEICGACNLTASPTFVMRGLFLLYAVESFLMLFLGLCYGSKFDSDYGWTGEMTEAWSEKYTFRGFSTSLLSWESQHNHWKLSLYRYNYAQIWLFFNNKLI